MSFEFLKDPSWRAGVLKDAFGKGFLGFLVFAVIGGVLCWVFAGREVFQSALRDDLPLLLNLLPRITIALLIAALIWVMLPRDHISRLVGSESGLAGLVIASLAGTITPGGPSSAYALLAALAASGADRGAVVAYITAWATLGMQRILVWDVPFMGPEFAMLRILVSLFLPIVAGLIARSLPLEVRFRGEEK